MIYTQLSLRFSLFFPADEKAKQKHEKYILYRANQTCDWLSLEWTQKSDEETKPIEKSLTRIRKYQRPGTWAKIRTTKNLFSDVAQRNQQVSADPDGHTASVSRWQPALVANTIAVALWPAIK